MSNFITSVLVICLGLVPWGAEAWAQEEVKKEEQLRFSCMYWEGAPAEDLFYREKETFRRLEFKVGTRSKNFSLKGAATFELYKEAEEPVEGEPPYDLLAKAKIPASKQVLFLVIPFEKEEGTEYKIVAMDDSLEVFPPGAFRIANFSSQTLMVKCGETVRKIPAREMSVVKSENSTGGGFVPFVIGNAQGETVFGTRIFGQPSGRELIFISPPAKKGEMPRVKFVSQLVAPSAEESAAGE